MQREQHIYVPSRCCATFDKIQTFTEVRWVPTVSLRLLGQVQCVTVHRFQPIFTYPLVVSSIGHLSIESVVVLININGGQSVSSVHPQRPSQGLVLCSNVRLRNKSSLQAYSCDGAMSREPAPSWNTNHYFSSKIDPTTT